MAKKRLLLEHGFERVELGMQAAIGHCARPKSAGGATLVLFPFTACNELFNLAVAESG